MKTNWFGYGCLLGLVGRGLYSRRLWPDPYFHTPSGLAVIRARTNGM
jgi:hypothetical protein